MVETRCSRESCSDICGLDDSPFLAVWAFLLALAAGSVLVLAVAFSTAADSDISVSCGADGAVGPSGADMWTGDSTVSSALHNFPKHISGESRHGYMEAGIN
jgi:hypothetical protein